MTDKVIKVNVTATKKQSVNISAGNIQNQITATPDSSQYYSNLSKNWAIGEGLIQGVDYSSKTYAKQAKIDANNAKVFSETAQKTYTNVQEEAQAAITNINNEENAAIISINNNKDFAISAVNTAKNEAVNSVNNTASNFAKKDLSNLSTVGQAKFDAKANKATTLSGYGITDGLNKTQITNCLLEVPQNIKLELNNGTLTLKAGSKVIVPNGANNFDEIITTQDYSVNTTANTTCTVYYSITYNKIEAFSGENSSSDADIETTGKVHYNTTANKITRINNSGAFQQLSFPIAKIVLSGSTVTEIKEVFQGMGYIGSTIWVDKGVKGLIPNGRNKDGSLKNTEYTTSKILTIKMLGSSPTIVSVNPNGTLTSSLYYTEQKEQPTGGQTLWYKPSENIMSRISANGTLVRPFYTFVVATNDCTNGVVSNFQPKLPFRAVDSNDFNKTPHIIDAYINGESWYRVYSDGWCEQGGRGWDPTFLKTFKDTNYTIMAIGYIYVYAVAINTKSTTGCTFHQWQTGNSAGNTTPVTWYACGYIS